MQDSSGYRRKKRNQVENIDITGNAKNGLVRTSFAFSIPTFLD
jgi:hypothetical protein